MVSLEHIHDCLQAQPNSSEIATTLNNLGTLLRDESNRADPLLLNIIPLVLSLYNAEPSEVIRVLVNYTADNDENRVYLTSQDPRVHDFWAEAMSQLNDTTLGLHTVLLFTQFIHNVDDDKKKIMLTSLLDLGVAERLLDYCSTCEENNNRDNLSMPLELLAEFTALNPKKFGLKDLLWVIHISSGIINECDSEDYNEMLLYSSQIALNVTNVDQLDGLPSSETSPILEIYDLMNKIPSDLENIAHIKRNFFSTCGNISSYIDYDNMLDLVLNSENLIKTNNDLYVAAALAILIGNCVSSRETQLEVIDQLRQLTGFEAIVEAVLHLQFGDVVQYQALHFFNNLFTNETADIILKEENISHLVRISKVVVDNCKYYKEIGGIYFKFMRKLVTTGFVGDRNVFLYGDVWNQLASAESDSGKSEVEMLLLQAISTSPVSKTQWIANSALVQNLLAETLSVEGTIDGTLILAKIKTLAVLLQNYSCTDMEASLGPETFVKTFAEPFYKLMEQLSQTLAESTTNHNAAGQKAAVANNTKYVAAIAAEKFSQFQTPEPLYQQIVTVCSAIVRH